MLILPNRCLMCHQEIAFPHQGICRVCLKACLYTSPVCLGCGRKMQLETDFCGHCLAVTPLKIVAPCSYHQGLGPFVASMKYQAQFAALDCLTDALILRVTLLYEQGLLPMPQVLVPVPLHKKRLQQRGFNQAWIIANCLSKKMNIPLSTQKLTRTQHTQAQAGLSGKARRKNMNKAFQLLPAAEVQRIALIDDVVTTGATTQAIACLFQRQHIHVQVWCLARAEAPKLMD
ncbi:double zinc ribbon domain-containing protein [uncultured Shewanella sp.]|uniref:ComF family protein n=1 Tax=uncultured Shewanella sp. TaxID=173975 RepID=UPI00260F33A7|nr:double zinc ribbon domain-containing protein [uncultured Shewanella sp.]